MNRERNYYREMRNKHINRKKKIAEHNGWVERHDGALSKGKVHCSCPMCANKTNTKHMGRVGKYWCHKPTNWKHSDLLKLQSMEDDLRENIE